MPVNAVPNSEPIARTGEDPIRSNRNRFDRRVLCYPAEKVISILRSGFRNFLSKAGKDHRKEDDENQTGGGSLHWHRSYHRPLNALAQNFLPNEIADAE